MSSPHGIAEQAGIAYSDIRSLQRLDTGDAGIEAAAQQFESLFIGMMLKSMREATAVLAEDNPLSSPELSMHQEMLDQQWSIHMAESGGVGLAAIIESQMRGERIPMPEGPAGPAGVGAPRDGPAEVEPAPTLGSKAPGYRDRASFVAEVLPRIEQAVAGTSLAPLHVLAQSALETGWGQKLIHGPDGASSHNLFGIKAGRGWQGESVQVKTLEVVDGRVEQHTARFRAYADVAAAVKDYVRFLENDGRYQQVLDAPDAEGFAAALERSGYATDPAYGRKVRAVIGSVKDLIGA